VTLDERGPELSSLASMLEDITGRLASMAESAAGGDEPLSAELFEIERNLQGAARRLTKLVDDLSALREP
jgi:hypothetical protein